MVKTRPHGNREPSGKGTPAFDKSNFVPTFSRRQFLFSTAALVGSSGAQPSLIEQILVLLSGRHDLAQPFYGETRSVQSLLDRTWKIPLYAPPSCSSLYLTFDDGPQPCSSRVVEALSRTEHKVTFFVIGRNLVSKELRDIAVWAIKAGHEIGNHSYSHPAFSSISAKQAEREIRSAHDIIQEVIEEAGGDPNTQDRFFRFPYGAPPWRGNEKVCYETLAELKYQIVWWDVDTKDWEMELQLDPRPFSRVIGSLKRAAAQDVVLMHDRPSTARHIDEMLRCVKSKGLTSVPLSYYRPR